MRKGRLFCRLLSLALVTTLIIPSVRGKAYEMQTQEEKQNTVISAESIEEEYKETLDEYAIPEWYRDAKFGIFIHYGVYAVPAYGDEWYPKWMYIPGGKTWGGTPIYEYNKKTYGSVSQGEGYGYKQFIPKFSEGMQTYKKNNMAQVWADLFKSAGAKYVMPVGIHHDGYALYDSDVQVTYNTVNNAGVDYIADLKEAVKKEGMKFGVSNHFAENDGYYDEDQAEEGADIKATDTTPDELYGDGKSNSDWHIKKWYDISMEIINKYKPDMIYYDYGINYEPYKRLEDANRYKMLATFYEQAKTNNPEGVVCNYKEGGFKPSQATFDKERSSLAKINPIAFQTDTSIGTKSWGYTTDEVFRSANDCIKALIDVVSKNGNLLLNVGPMPDGTIPDKAQETLRSIGDWLTTYGDAIYGTRPWVTYGEGPTGTSYDNYNFTERDIRFTRSKDYKKLYATVMSKPTNDNVIITTLNSNDFKQKIGAVKLNKGSEREELQFEQCEDGLEIYLPSDYESTLTGPFAMEITAEDGNNISTVATSAIDGFEANNYADEEGVTVTACPNDGTDMIVSKKENEAYATYNIAFGSSIPEIFSGSFSGDSNGVVEFYLGGKNGKKVGEINLTGSENGEYYSEKTRLDLRSVTDSNIELTVVFKGDIKFSSFKLISRNPGEVIEAEGFDDKNGSLTAETTKDTEGGVENLGYVEAGDWAKYSDVNFAYGLKEFAMRYASQNNSGLEIRLDSIDGPVVVTADAESTGSWNIYETAAFDVSTVDGKKVIGYHDIYLKFTSPMNLNWFKFEACDPVNPTSMSLVKDNATIEAGQTYWIDMDFEPYDASERQLEYVSDNESVAVVSASGEITGITPGTAKIQITSKAVSSLKAEFIVTVLKTPAKPPVNDDKKEDNNSNTNNNTNSNGNSMVVTSNNTYSPTSNLLTSVKNYLGKKITLKKGKKITIQAFVMPKQAKQGCNYQTSNSKVAEVTDKGVVKAKKAGTAKITVTSADGIKKAIYKIEVVKKDKVNRVLKLANKKIVLKKGKSKQIICKKLSKKTTSIFKFKSSKKGVATVNAYGTILAKKKGNAVVVVTCGKKSQKIKVKVK